MLLDTGPLVAYLDPRDPAHRQCVEAFDGFRGKLLTTEAVIGEAMYFSMPFISGPQLLLKFLKQAGVEINSCCQPLELRHAVDLMFTYADTPMDFADATLVVLGEKRNVRDICTLDRRGFSTFRTAGGKAFRNVIPARKS